MLFCVINLWCNATFFFFFRLDVKCYVSFVCVDVYDRLNNIIMSTWLAKLKSKKTPSSPTFLCKLVLIDRSIFVKL